MKKTSLISGFIITLSLVGVEVAAPPGSPFNLGETLDPACAPGDPNCTVVAPAASGDNSDITQLDAVNEMWVGADEASAQNTFGKSTRSVNVETTNTDPSTGWAPINLFDSYIEPSAGQAAGATRISMAGYSTAPASNTNQIQTLHGVEGGAENHGTGPVGVLSGLVGWAYNSVNAVVGTIFGSWHGAESDAGTVTDLIGLAAENYVYGGTVTNWKGIQVGPGDFGGGTVTNRYSVYIPSHNGTPTTSDFGIYQEDGNQDNYFGGQVGIGATDPKSLGLHVNGDIGVSHGFNFGNYFYNGYFDPIDARDERINAGYAVKTTLNPSGNFSLNVADTAAADTAITWIPALSMDNTNGYVGFNAASTHPINMTSGAHVTAGGVWTDVSTREAKENIEEVGLAAAYDAVMSLEPVSFNYKEEPEEKYLGFIAEDVPELVAKNDRKSLASMDIVAALTKVIQDQEDRMKEQEDRIKKLEETIKNK
jgi:hypothetical protein